MTIKIKNIAFLEKADRFHGVWPHWLDGKTGKVQPFSKKDDGGDLVETAFMVQGLLAVAEYFNGTNPKEKLLVSKIDTLWRGIEWNWYTQGKNTLYWHWSPNYGWEMNFPVGGYNECLIMYVLAAASPTFPKSTGRATFLGSLLLSRFGSKRIDRPICRLWITQ